MEMADEAYALKLQAELNGQRPPRERSRLGATPPPRTTRSAGRANGAVKYTYSDVSLAGCRLDLCLDAELLIFA